MIPVAESPIKKPNYALFIDEITMPNSITNTLISFDMRGYANYIILGASVYNKNNKRWEALSIGADDGLVYLSSAAHNYRPYVTSQYGVDIFGGQKAKIALLLFN